MTIADQPTFLNTRYEERDRVKSLGARWDGTRRRWFVPAGLDLTPFRPWLDLVDQPAPVQTAAAGPDPLESRFGRSPDNAPQMSVGQFVSGVRAAVLGKFDHDLWIVGQITSLKERKGLVVLEITDPDDTRAGGARLDLKAFTKVFEGCRDKLQAETGEVLREGLTVRFKIRPEFDPRFHLGGLVIDIDPSATLGAHALLMRRLRAKLKQEGLFDANRRLPSPRLFTRVAVIHPRGASGFNDFRADADRLERLGLCRFVYLPAAFEGGSVERDILDAFAAAERAHRQGGLDAVCLIRGGGSRQGLMQLSTEALARAVCACPVPVLTGLGHAEDDTMLDEVANLRLDTPSKVVGHIRGTIQTACRAAVDDVQRIHRRATATLNAARQAVDQRSARIDGQARLSATRVRQIVEDRHLAVERQARRLRDRLVRAEADVGALVERIRTTAPRRLERMGEGIVRLGEAIVGRARLGLERARTSVDTASVTTARAARRRMGEMETAVETNIARTHREAGRRIEIARREAEAAARIIEAMSPDATVARGFALVFDGEEVVTDRATARGRARLTLRFRDGTLDVVPVADPTPPARTMRTRQKESVS